MVTKCQSRMVTTMYVCVVQARELAFLQELAALERQQRDHDLRTTFIAVGHVLATDEQVRPDSHMV